MSVSLKAAAYESARSELLERIRLRDQNLVAYLAVVGAILGFTFKDGSIVTDEIMLLSIFSLPIICVVFSSIVLNHHHVVGKIGEYLTVEFCVQNNLACWDNSTVRNSSANDQGPRFWSQLILLIIPMVFVLWSLSKLWIASQDSADQRTIMMLAAFLNILCIGYVLYTNWITKQRRVSSEAARIPHVAVKQIN